MLSRVFRLRVITGLIIALCVVGISISFAQEFRASIIGKVSDPSGAAVPGATVTAIQRGTNQTYTGTSNSAGVFSVVYINPGQFTVKVEAKGFKSHVYPNVTLEAGQKLNLNVSLTLGSVHQQVTVTASPGLLNTTSASSGGVIDQTKVKTLPTENGRSVWATLEFAQGVRSAGYGDIVSYVFAPNGVGGHISVEGAPGGQNTYYVNGAPVSPKGSVQFTPQLDSVQEVQVSASGGAQYGPGTGGAFTTVIKQGTNRFHGNLFEYITNKALGANQWQNDISGTPKPQNNHNDFGGTVGGPIRKNKTFFFFGFEAERTNQPLPRIDSVPTAAMRNGDFSGTGYTIYDPSTVTCVNMTSSGCSQYGRSAFPNDMIPSSRINPIGAAIMGLYPAPNLPGTLSNFTGTAPRFTNYTQYISRVDQNISQTTRLSGSFSYQSTLLPSSGNAFPGVANNNTDNTSHYTTAVVDLTHTFSPSLVGDLRASFGRSTTFITHGVAVQKNYSVSGLTMPVVPTTTHQNIAPTISASGYTGMIGNTGNGTVGNTWYLSPSLSQIKGRHSLKYGFQFMDVQSGASGIPGSPNGGFAFTPSWTQENPLKAAAGSGNSLADLLLGYPSSGSVNWSINPFITYHYYAAYIQDAFKIRRNLTLDVGLRWSAFTSPTERHNGINGTFCFTCTNPYDSQVNHAAYPNLQNPLTGGLTFAGVSAPAAPYDVKLNHWQPRIGIAWAITPKTVIRARFGIYYGVANPADTSIGFSQTTSYIPSLDGGITPTDYFFSGSPYPNGVVAPAGSSGGLATSTGDAIAYNSPSNVIPWTQHWGIGFQRELPKRILLDVEYVGSHSNPLAVKQPWDVISSAQQAACFQDNAICNTTVPNPLYGVLPSNVPLGSSAKIPAWELMRSQPLFNGVTQNNNPAGYSVYNALEFRVERKIKSLDFVANYTWSNNMYADAYLNSGNFVDSNLFYGPWSNEQRGYFTSDVVLPLPVGQGGLFFKSSHGFLGQLINHWQGVSAIRYFTGFPLPIPSANLVGGPGCTSYAPVGGQTRAHWFNNNESCYQTLNQWQARTTPLRVGYLRAPSYYDWNAGFEKRFALPFEGVSLQFRAECNNCANSHRWGTGVNTNVAAIPRETSIGPEGFGTLGHSDAGSARTIFGSLELSF